MSPELNSPAITAAIDELCDRYEDALQAGERPAHLLQEALAAFSQRKAPRTALEKPHAERRFEAPHVLAHGRGRQPENSRRRGEAAVLRRLRKGDQVLELGGSGPCATTRAPPRLL